MGPMAAIDSGDTAWILVSSALVLLMTPGLAFFYGGLVREKNVWVPSCTALWPSPWSAWSGYCGVTAWPLALTWAVLSASWIM